METKEEILTLIHKYLEEFTDEKDKVNVLVQFVNAHEGEALISRKNFTGHITTSAFIVNESGDKLLLLKHKSLNRWLQPGGHADVTDASLKAGALREAIEETGLSAENMHLLSSHIFDVDSHQIPANNKKNEPAHVHHDIRFLYKCLNTNTLQISLEESTASKWITITELAENGDFYGLDKKIKMFL